LSKPIKDRDCDGESKDCEVAYKNPLCPYVTEINKNTNAICTLAKGILGLLGEDCTGLNGGIIHTIMVKIDQLNESQRVQKSWINIIRPIAIGAISALTVSGITYLVFHLAI